MKKLLLLASALVFALGLAACTPEEEPDPDPECEAGEVLVDGECVMEDEDPTIAGVDNTSVKIGQSFNPLAGVTATDPEDGDLTSSIAISGTVDLTTQGNYTLTYTVIDSAGNVVQVQRVVGVTVGDPAFFRGLEDVELEVGDTFDPAEGVTATDPEDGNVTADIVINAAQLDLTKAGTYTVSYSVTDSAGNTTVESITVTVVWGDKIVITYAGWNVGTAEANNLVRRTIDAFNEQSNTIVVEIVEYEGSYNDFLATKAAAGEFPDIVLSGNVPDFIIAGYAGDITDIAMADDEWTDIPQNLRDAVTYNGNIYAIPSSTNFLGMFANLDLIDDSNITTDFTQFDYTYTEWIDAVRDATDATHTDGTSTAGITHPGNLINWLPAVLDSESAEPLGIEHFAWADGEFLLNSDPVKDALAEAANIFAQGWTVAAYDTAAQGTTENPLPSERQELFGDNWDGRAFRNGQTAFNWDGTWGSGGLATAAADAGFDIQFVGLPGGHVVGVQDFMTISKTAEHPEAAFEVAKWLTFGVDGINNRFDLVENVVPDTENGESSLSISGLPVNRTAAVVEQWFENYPVAGVEEYFNAAADGTVTVLNEGNKFVPGFLWARFWYDTGIDALISRPNNTPGSTLSIGDLLYDAQLGRIDYATYMTPELENQINYQFVLVYNDLLEVISSND